MIDGVVGALGSRADEGIPVQGAGNLVYLFGAFQTLGPDGTVGEGIHMGHLANLTVPDPLTYEVYTLATGSLVAHLGGHISLGGQLGQQA